MLDTTGFQKYFKTTRTTCTHLLGNAEHPIFSVSTTVPVLSLRSSHTDGSEYEQELVLRKNPKMTMTTIWTALMGCLLLGLVVALALSVALISLPVSLLGWLISNVKHKDASLT